MSRRDRHDIGRFIASLALFVAVAIVVPIGLVAVSRSRFGSANPLAGAEPPWQWFRDGAGSAMGEPITDDALIDGLIRVCLCVVWAAVAVIVVTTVLEVVHGVRHRGLAMPAVRGLGPVQRLARFIAVGIIVVLPVLTPAPSIASTIGRAPPTVTVDTPRTGPVTGPLNGGPGPDALVPADTPQPGMRTYIVRPGDSVYSIAERLAGGGTRVIEIADAIVEANLGATMAPGQRFTNPAYIEQGWALQVPAGRVMPTDHAANDHAANDRPTIDHPTTYEVQPGDTLWHIADDQLGEPTDWPEIWERNRGRDMGDGRTFDDPNLILPGWDLEIGDVVDDTPPPESTTPDGSTTWDGSTVVPEAPGSPDVPAVATPTTAPPASPPSITPTTSAPVGGGRHCIHDDRRDRHTHHDHRGAADGRRQLRRGRPERSHQCPVPDPSGARGTARRWHLGAGRSASPPASAQRRCLVIACRRRDPR